MSIPNTGPTGPFLIYVDENDELLGATAGIHFLPPSVLRQIAEAARRTLTRYRSEKITDARIEEMNEQFLDDIARQVRSSRQIKQPRAGSVYVMQDDSLTSTFKIGFTSRDPKVREETLQAEKPSISLLFVYHGNRQDETRLHKHFKEQRLRGEWFSLDEADLRFIHNYFEEKNAHS